MKVTKKYLKEWIDAKFKELEMNFKVSEIYTTRFRQDDYEAGACKQQIILEQGNMAVVPYFLCFYSIKEIEQHLNQGYELWLKFDQNHIISHTSLELRRR